MAETYTIRVINDTRSAPNEVGMIEAGGKTKETSARQLLAKADAIKYKQTKKVIGILSTASAVAVKLRQDYLSFVGQNAKANRLKLATKYTGIGIGLALKANPAVAIGALALTSGKDMLNYRVTVEESNAMAKYLREQSMTSVDNSKGNYYKFKW